MNLDLTPSIANKYRSLSQAARVLTEHWMKENMFCPICGNESIEKYENNRPVADFFCNVCSNDYELKSKNGEIKRSISDGAYDSMIQRITSCENPNLFVMGYSLNNMRVNNLMIVPKYFFTPNIIQKRKPLAPTARRAGWIGCNIIIGDVPAQGVIPIIQNGLVVEKKSIITRLQKSQNLELKQLHSRGWLFDVLMCVNKTLNDVFSLADIYNFAEELSAKHPENNNIEAKIRQQLQFLRDKGFIQFLGNGVYQKVK